ncbi:hypothetical protein R7892_09955 [Ligilactobacillus murinus]|uniref:hypothetical protein n=1 Tax=Ligilactobacillus murinus TaxID=1622 RepID=UPI00296B3067|nr:hypothetical protein [Ligilactobacillus murinus]WOY88990.1 hypothetical protein R7892_09955 [Ligilactobacillus murinus]
MARKKTTPEEIKLALKKEIIRLGIEDNPSRTVYQKQYERGAAPSPNNAMNITDMKWQELMKDIGFDYDGKKNNGLSAKKNVNLDRAPRYNYDDPEVRKETMDRVVVAIRNNGYTKPTDLEKNLKSKIGVGYKTLQRHGFTWEEIIKEYKNKYDEAILRNSEKERTSWSQFSNKELLDMVTKVVKENNSTSLENYDKNHRSKYRTPMSSVLLKRFNVTVPELWQMIQINGDLPIK